MPNCATSLYRHIFQMHTGDSAGFDSKCMSCVCAFLHVLHVICKCLCVYVCVHIWVFFECLVCERVRFCLCSLFKLKMLFIL